MEIMDIGVIFGRVLLANLVRGFVQWINARRILAASASESEKSEVRRQLGVLPSRRFPRSSKGTE